MTEERRRAVLISDLTTVLLSMYNKWQLTTERGTMHLVIYDGVPNHVFTLRDDISIKRCINALKGGE